MSDVRKHGGEAGRVQEAPAPMEERPSSAIIFGCLAGTVTIHGDVVAPSGEAWESDA